MHAVDSPRGRRRSLTGALLSALVLLLLDPRPAYAAEPGVPDPPSNLLEDTGKGAITEADKDFVVKVRLAGLWEIPAGRMAQEKSQNRGVRSIGEDIADQHVQLDKLVIDAAEKLEIPLPDEPNADQQGWLDEMENAADGREFDQIYIDRLRAAHGKIFPAIATIRAGTRNDTVRKLAQRANQFVMTHLTLLESSEMVDFAALPTVPPPNAAAAPTPVASTANTGGVSLPIVGILVLAAIAGSLFISWRVMQGGNKRRYRQRPRGRSYGY